MTYEYQNQVEYMSRETRLQMRVAGLTLNHTKWLNIDHRRRRKH